MFFTTAARCVAHSASHPAIDVGAFSGVVLAVVVDPPDDVEVDEAPAADVVVAAESLLSSPPQAAATSTRANRAAPARSRRPLVRVTSSPLAVTPLLA